MKIDEKLVSKEKNRVYSTSYLHTFYPRVISDDDLFFSSIFTLRASRRLPWPYGPRLQRLYY